MTPGARVQAAIEIIDAIADGVPAEQALTRWARTSRFAGSKDRAAVRDHVFDVLRRWRSTAADGGGETGRARMLGLLRQNKIPLESIFHGAGHAPQPVSPEEEAQIAQSSVPRPLDAQLDVPAWLYPHLCEDVAPGQLTADLEALRHRAPVDLRVNLLKTNRSHAQQALAECGIATQKLDLCATALRITENPRQLGRAYPFLDGLVELQDVASQAVVAHVPLAPGMRVLDYCSGGGGKALAIAGQTKARVWAHDADPKRMRDLPKRADRAGADIDIVTAPEGLFDLVMCDVPCSGSGSWRRAPDGKWRLSEQGLAHLLTVQAEIMDTARGFLRPGGTLAYATCSLLACENGRQVAAALDRHPDLILQSERHFRLTDGGDGFYVAVLTKA